MGIKIAVVNRTKRLADADMIDVVAALQFQNTAHFGPAWGIFADYGFVPTGEEASASMWQQIVVDEPLDPGTLGEHLTTPLGMPIGYTSLQADLDAGQDWRPTLSHEAVEMCADPWCFAVVRMPDNRDVWLEVGDPCEAVSYDVTLENGHVVPLSDFALPAWFGNQRAKPIDPFTFMGSVLGPFQLAPGGYMGIVDASGNVTQVTARIDPNRAAHREAPAVGSRRWRRGLR